jgi:hypothetical protein
LEEFAPGGFVDQGHQIRRVFTAREPRDCGPQLRLIVVDFGSAGAVSLAPAGRRLCKRDWSINAKADKMQP